MKKQGVAALLLGMSMMGAGTATMAAQSQPARPARVRAKLDGFDIQPGSGKGGTQVAGASRDLGGKFVLYAPKMGKAYTLTPTFMWSAEAGDEFLFRLSILSAGRGQVYEQKVTGGQLTYPPDAPALKPGATYVWQVTPVNDMLGGPASASVLIVDGADRTAVETALHGAAPTTAQAAKVFVDKRLWYDAIAAYTGLIQSSPDHSSYYKDRAELYDQLPQTQDLADADYMKAQK